MQVTFREGGNDTYALLGSDANHEMISQIVQISRKHNNADRLPVGFMKLFHHRSYLSLSPDRGTEETTAVDDVAWLFETQGWEGGIIVSPSWPIPAKGSKEDGDVPAAAPSGRQSSPPGDQEAEWAIHGHDGKAVQGSTRAVWLRRYRLWSGPHHRSGEGQHFRRSGHTACWLMSVESWLGTFDESINGADFRHKAAAEVARYLGRYGAQAGTLCGGRRRGQAELVILDLLTGAPQRPVYPIQPIERIGIVFTAEDMQPSVLMLRDDFPDTEHQLLVPEDWPHTICIDDRLWAEARLTWTPGELIERILTWFRRAGRGELHDARQPIDPILMGSSIRFSIARALLDADESQDLVAQHAPTSRTILRVSQAHPGLNPATDEPFSIIAYRVSPQVMKRLKWAPNNLMDSAAMLEDRGILLFDDLKDRLRGWLDAGTAAAWRLNSRFAVIVEMPIISPQGEQRDGIDHRAFITNKVAGDIAVALGIAEPSDGFGSKVGYVRMIVAAPQDQAAIAAITVLSAEVYLDFDRGLATQLAGRVSPDIRKTVLVGAGAIGSHVADWSQARGPLLLDDH